MGRTAGAPNKSMVLMTGERAPARLTEQQLIAADMMGRCIPRAVILETIGFTRKETLTNWLQIPEFQDLVAASNRAWMAEIRANNSRIVQTAQDRVLAILTEVGHPMRDQIAWEVVRATIGYDES